MKNENLKLAGNEVFLRYPDPADFDEVAALNRSSAKKFPGFVDSSYDREIFDRLLANVNNETLEPFYICRNDGVIVGTITLSQIFRKKFQNAYLGYMLGSAYTGHGYMTEAVGIILKYAFQRLRLHRIEANVQPENLPSIAVLRRCGFVQEGFSRKYLKIGGRWRDHERWAIIKEDWKAK